DAVRRRRLTGRLRRHFLGTGQTVVLVTHALSDAVRICDRYLWLEQGRATRAGDVHELALAGLMTSRDGGGPSTIVDCRVANRHDQWGLLEVVSPLGTLWIESSGVAGASTDLRISIRAADVSISLSESERTSILNRLWLEVESISEPDEHPGQRLVLLRGEGEGRLAARLTAYSVQRLGLGPGLRVLAQIKAVAVEH
ncbi:MAG: TOBE domain-containing protein, partial [Gammaproteobacteria bacterium]